MAKLHTDCVERPLRQGFEILGYFVGSHPWWFLIAPLILSTSLGSGFYFLKQRTSNSIEEQFTPVDGPAKAERKYIQETFRRNDSMFSSLRLSTDGSYATLIATSNCSVLSLESLQDVVALDWRIRSMEVQADNQTFRYLDICAQVSGRCTSNDVLDIIQYEASNIAAVNLTFPWHHSHSGSIPLALSLGGVRLKNGSSVVESAEAMQLFYYLREDKQEKARLWLESFLKLLSNQSWSIQVSYSTSMSMQWEFDKSPSSVISMFSVTYVITITFSILSCWRSDNVRTKVCVAVCGVVSTGLAVLSGFGVLLLLNEPFVMTAASCPFMLLGIGLDDMFILISCWQRTRVLDGVPDRLAITYRDAAVSMSVTSLTNALALFLGCGSPFGSVRSFCVYAGVSVCFCYFYSVTFLGACMALNGQREAGNKHWLTCVKIPEDLPPTRSQAFRVCCVGGSYNRITEKEEKEPVNRFFEQFYGPILTHKLSKALVFVVYVAYVAVSVYGCFRLKEGLEVRNLALDDSYLVDYHRSQKEHFSSYGCKVMVAVTQPFPYWDEDELKRLHSCVSDRELVDQASGTLAWFLSFQRYANASALDIRSPESFHHHLSHYLQLYPEFRQDLNASAQGHIWASRFFIQTPDRSSLQDVMIGLRAAAEGCPVELLVYHPSFVYYDQYTVIMSNTVQTVLVAVVAMLAVSLVLIPSPLCSLWVAAAICSIVVGVAGFMALWGVNLDSISMINLVMCIGFSVDFSAHVTYSFVSSPKADVNEKAREALAHLGYPIVQGALSTVLGVVVLSMSGSYIFRTFFKIVFLVIVFGLLHGLVFIPVFLTLFGANGK